MGADVNGRKLLLTLIAGQRESAEQWLEVLRDLNLNLSLDLFLNPHLRLNLDLNPRLNLYLASTCVEVRGSESARTTAPAS